MSDFIATDTLDNNVSDMEALVCLISQRDTDVQSTSAMSHLRKLIKADQLMTVDRGRRYLVMSVQFRVEL